VWRAIARSINAVTETDDFMTAMWDALPEKFRKVERAKRHGKRPRMAERWKQVYQNLDQIDVAAAIKEVIKNQAEDYIIGKASKKAGDAYKRATGAVTGPGPTGYGKSSRQIEGINLW